MNWTGRDESLYLNRIEVWSKEKWNEICDYDDMDSIAESMQDMGITI